MLQPRCRPALSQLPWQFPVAGPSIYRPPSSPSSRAKAAPPSFARSLHSSNGPRTSPSIASPPQAFPRHRLSAAALAASPVAASPIPDSVTQLLLSSPLPPGWTVILLTIFLRSSITLPLTLWSRRRLQRTRTLVIPAMREYNERIALALVRESRAAGKTYGEYRKALKDRLATYQRELHRKYGTHPLPTIVVPLGVHIPLLIGLSLTIRRMVEMPGGWGEQGFWWLEKLGEVDTTGVLPIVGGLMAFANAEVVSRKVRVLEEASASSMANEDAPSMTNTTGGQLKDTATSTKAAPQMAHTIPPDSPPPRPATPAPAALPTHLSRRDPPSASRAFSSSSSTLALPRPRSKRPPSSPSATAVQPSGPRLTTMESPEAISEERRKTEIRTKFFSNVMRIGAVLFIPIAAQVPSGLALYWTVSMVFTFVQNLLLNRMDVRDAVRARS